MIRSKYATVGREYGARSMLGDRLAPVGGGGYPSTPTPPKEHSFIAFLFFGTLQLFCFY